MNRLLSFGIVLAFSSLAWADSKDGYEVHDMSRPMPPVVTPGEQPGGAPSDAIVLFDGKDLAKWSSGDADAKWKLVNGQMEIAPGTGSLRSREQFGDCQIHLEWREPEDIAGKSQGRGNSGVMIMGMFELQILDSYKNDTYPDGMAGAIYGQYPPLANAIRPPGQWNVYDIVFRAPRVDENGKLTKAARIIALFNGVLVQDDMELIGTVAHKALAKYPEKLPAKGPLELQDHGNRIRFRNIWIRPIPEKPQPPVRPAGEGH